MILSLFGCVVFTTGRFELSCLALCFSVSFVVVSFLFFFFFFFFSVLFSIVITSFWEERAVYLLCASRAFVSFILHVLISVLFSSWYQGLTAACDYGALWSFLLVFKRSSCIWLTPI